MKNFFHSEASKQVIVNGKIVEDKSLKMNYDGNQLRVQTKDNSNTKNIELTNNQMTDIVNKIKKQSTQKRNKLTLKEKLERLLKKQKTQKRKLKLKLKLKSKPKTKSKSKTKPKTKRSRKRKSRSSFLSVYPISKN